MRSCGFVLLTALAVFSLWKLPSLWGGFIENLVFSKKSYSQNIEINGWLVNESQVREAICEGRDPVQLTYGELTHKRCYFLVQMRNLKHYRAWGTLEITSPNNFSTSVFVVDVEPYQKGDEYFVIPVGVGVFSYPEHEEKPTVTFKWKDLYMK